MAVVSFQNRADRAIQAIEREVSPAIVGRPRDGVRRVVVGEFSSNVDAVSVLIASHGRYRARKAR